MDKIAITNISAVGIICRKKDRGQLFLEIKDDGHPIKHARRKLCFIGGNWIGDAAKNDRSTRDTYMRELKEELSFERPMRNSIEYAKLGIANAEVALPTPMADVEVSAADREDLSDLCDAIVAASLIYGDFLVTVTKAALDAADPNNKRDGFTTLVSYWISSLAEPEWHLLTALQKKFNNLSNESITLITSIDEIVEAQQQTAFGHDHVLLRLFGHRPAIAARMPMVPGTLFEPTGHDIALDYREYLEIYDVAKKPI